MQVELKACAHCGGSNLKDGFIRASDEVGWFFVECECGAQVHGPTAKNAHGLWNTRFEASLPPSAPDQEAIARKAKQLGDAEGDPNWWRFKDAALAALAPSVLAESTSNDCLLVAEGWQDEAGLADQGCRIPPNGWHCTRERGHDGPCAAHRVGRPLGAGWSPVPQGEATHDERLTDDELSALGLGVSEWAYKHLARGYAVSLSVREIKRLIAALSRTPAVTDLSGVGVG